MKKEQQKAWPIHAPRITQGAISRETVPQLEARRSAELQYLKDNDSHMTTTWYLIDREWLDGWKQFALRAGPLPGPIRNERLVDVCTGKPRPNLKLAHDYRGINADIWKYFLQRYGGGPAIQRHQLDLYAPPIGSASASPEESSTLRKHFATATPEEPNANKESSRQRACSFWWWLTMVAVLGSVAKFWLWTTTSKPLQLFTFLGATVQNRTISQSATARPASGKTVKSITLWMPQHKSYCEAGWQSRNLDHCKHFQLLPPVASTHPLSQNCKSRFGAYMDYYFFFTHAMLISSKLAELTGARIIRIDNPLEADIRVCNALGVSALQHADSMAVSASNSARAILIIDDFDGASVCSTPQDLASSKVVGVAKTYVWNLAAGRGWCLNGREKPAKNGTCSGEHRLTRVQALLKNIHHVENYTGALTAERINGIISWPKGGCLSAQEEGDLYRDKVFAAIPFPELVKDYYQHEAIVARNLSRWTLQEFKARKYDVAFIGSFHLSVPIVRAHRVGLLKTLGSIANRHRKWRIFVPSPQKQEIKTKHDLWRFLNQVRIFVSPFGHGEWSGKDTETIRQGAVLMKPGASLLSPNVPIYSSSGPTDHVTCLECNINWKNLEASLVDALSDLPRLHKIRLNAIAAVDEVRGFHKALSRSRNLDQFASMVERAVTLKQK